MLSVILICILSKLSSAVHENHNKPFGTGPTQDIETLNGFIDPFSFLNHYVNNNKPLLMKQAAKDFPAIKNWDDDYFLKMDLTKFTKKTISVERQKKENRSLNSFEIDFQDFIRTYNTTNAYMVDSIPQFLNRDIFVPWSLQCKILEENIYQVLMWFSSGGTSSVVHTDDMENINCLIRGKKTFVLVDPYKHKDKIPLNNIGAYSDIDVDMVDFTKYKQMSSVDFIVAKMVAGDCLYLPKLWIHQVRSYDRNIAINIWFRTPTPESEEMSQSKLKESCNLSSDHQKTFNENKFLGLDKAFYHKKEIHNLFSDFKNKNAESLFQLILELYNDVEYEIMNKSSSHIKAVIFDIIEELDRDKDTVIDQKEIEEMTKENFDRVTNYVAYLKTFLESLTKNVKNNIFHMDNESESTYSHREL